MHSKAFCSLKANVGRIKTFHCSTRRNCCSKNRLYMANSLPGVIAKDFTFIARQAVTNVCRSAVFSAKSPKCTGKAVLGMHCCTLFNTHRNSYCSNCRLCKSANRHSKLALQQFPPISSIFLFSASMQ